jgi:hypothetical protein
MKTYFLLLQILFFGIVHAQKDTAIQNLENKIIKEADINAKLDLVRTLGDKGGLYYPDLVQSYIDKALFWAEESRDRNAMVKARRIAANFYLYQNRGKTNIDKAKLFAEEALALSKKDGISFKEQVAANGTMAGVQMYFGKSTEAIAYSQESVNIANESNSDSLKILSRLTYGNVLLRYNDKIKAFKSYIAAQELAEKSNKKEIKDLLFTVYTSLVSFYSGIENYDKAIDYQYKKLAYFKQRKEVEKQLEMLEDIGENYREAKKFNAAKGIYEEMGRLADSMQNPIYKTRSHFGQLNVILDGDEKEKGIDFIKNHPDINLYFQKADMQYLLDYGYANIYHRLNKNDSSNYYYEKALPSIESKANIFQQIDFYAKYGYHLYTVGIYPKAINILNKAKFLADSTKTTKAALSIVEYLDSCYQKTGDYKQAFYYSSLKNKIKEELDEKSKAKDVLMLEIESENKRAERLAKEEEEATQKRHNWQYMGIIVAIISLFSLLAVLGVFNVSIKLVRALGFISFIFLFEFIILLADNFIHHATHGEPWKVLGIKVILIALLLPLHHWLEHKAIHFITTRRKKEVTH